MVEVRLILALICLFIAIAGFPAAAIAKYGKKNRKMTTAFVAVTVLSTLLFMIFIWPYLPD